MTFNNCNASTNGESLFFSIIESECNNIFDVGCREDTLFTKFKGSVHYFDPVEKFCNNLTKQLHPFRDHHVNNFGLGSVEETKNYYTGYQSFLDRETSCKCLNIDEGEIIPLKIKKAITYIIDSGIVKIDFLKIDTEGFEYEVLKGFEEKINIVKYIQFEYGGTYIDSGVKLVDIIDYLKSKNFTDFRYLTGFGSVPITHYSDHYQ